MARGPRPGKIEEWSRRLERLQASGASVAQFCKAEAVSTASVYRWMRILGRRAATRSNTNKGTFREVRLRQHSAPVTETGITIRLPGDIEVAASDPQVVELVLDKVLGAAGIPRKEDTAC